MRKGKSLTELATEIERQSNSKRDMIANTASVSLIDSGSNGVQLQVGNADNVFDIGETAHDQLGQYTGIPAKYYDRMRAEQPELLRHNVNTWLQQKSETRLVRTLDNRVRAVLSDGYRPLEHVDLANMLLPVLLDMDLDVMSCEITERRMYIKAVDKRIHRDVPTGRKMGDGTHQFFDTMAPAIIISNSEIGYGQLSVESGVYTRACTNLAMIAANGMKRRHVGARNQLADGETIRNLLSDETKRVTDKAIWMQARDVVMAAFNETRFAETVERIAPMAEQRITGKIEKVVELTAKHFTMHDGERDSVLRHLIEGGDLTRYGLFNAITRTAEDLESYDRASEFERMGGQLIELPRNDWERITATN